MRIEEVARHLHAGFVPPKALNGKSPRYSATTLKQMVACQRRHFFEQVVGINPPIGPALIFGTKLHSHLEHYLKHGTVPRVGPNAEPEERLAASGLKHLPLPGTPGMHVEAPFKFVAWPNGPTFTGTADLFVGPADEDTDEGPDTVELYDHKSTGDYQRYARNGWALSADDDTGPARKYLRDDAQAIMYALALIRRYRVQKGVTAKWVYYQKNGLPAVPVKAFLERERVLHVWREELTPVVELMHHQHTTRPALATIPASEDHCDSFGGCPHRAYCVGYTGPRSTNADTGEGDKIVGKLADSLMKEAKEPKKTDAAPALNPPPAGAGNPFKSVTEATAEQPTPTEQPKTEKKSKLSASVAAEQAPATTPAPEPKKAKQAEQSAPVAAPTTATAPTTAGFNLYVGCEPVKGAKRDTVLVADLVQQATEVLRANFEKSGKDWNEALRFGEVQKRVMDLIAQTIDKDPSVLGGKNVRAPMHGIAAEVAVNVLASRATAFIQASAL